MGGDAHRIGTRSRLERGSARRFGTYAPGCEPPCHRSLPAANVIAHHTCMVLVAQVAGELGWTSAPRPHSAPSLNKMRSALPATASRLELLASAHGRRGPGGGRARRRRQHGLLNFPAASGAARGEGGRGRREREGALARRAGRVAKGRAGAIAALEAAAPRRCLRPAGKRAGASGGGRERRAVGGRVAPRLGRRVHGRGVDPEDDIVAAVGVGIVDDHVAPALHVLLGLLLCGRGHRRPCGGRSANASEHRGSGGLSAALRLLLLLLRDRARVRSSVGSASCQRGAPRGALQGPSPPSSPPNAPSSLHSPRPSAA